MDNQEVQKPKDMVDSSPLAMERNRESLKIKLMVRRSANQLVEQGILPPLKTSPAIHEQKKLLERAKTGDLLKAKIQQRPDRQELERRHILESHEGHIDPSLADKYRMLEKAILVDQLNSKISHRPGPLELIEKNILHANEPIERIVKEGLVPFKASTDNLYVEDDSQSSEGDPVNVHGDNNSLIMTNSINIVNDQPIQFKSTATSIEHVAPPLNVINLNLPIHTSVIAQSTLVPKLTLKIPSTATEHETITLPCLVTTESLVPIATTTVHNERIVSNEKIPLEIISNKEPKINIDGNVIKHHISSFLQNNQKFSSSGGKEKIKKKCKIKPTAKIKAIKFHEYKGPPNAQKNSTLNLPSTSSTASLQSNNKKLGETNYELIMQQQCLLEYLEGIYKNQNKIENDSQEKQTTVIHEKVAEPSTEDVKKPFITIFPSKSPTSNNTNNTVDKDALITDVIKLSKMKVSELKSYLKKLNLPVSGPKPLLVERLKPYLPFKPSEICKNNKNVESIIMPQVQEILQDPQLALKISNNSVDSIDTQIAFKDDDSIVKEQQRKIEELQRKLLESQSELEQIKLGKASESSNSVNNNNNGDQFFQIIPDSNNIQTSGGVLYDTKYQIPNKVPTLFVVGVTPMNTTDTIAKLPMIVHDEEEEKNNNCNINNNNQILDADLVLSNSPVNPSEIELNKTKSNNLYSNAIVQDDINDVLEILLKNEKWNGNADKSGCIDEDNKILLDAETSFINENDNAMEFKKDILEGTLMNNNNMLTSQAEQSIKNDSLISFPMEVEDNSNIDSLSYFTKDSHDGDLQCRNNNINNNNINGFGNLCNTILKTNDSTFDKNVGIKNSLIGNFDNGMFDTFKTNIVSGASGNSLLSDTDHKESKYNHDKYIFNNINNFDLFGSNSIELQAATPMDFENIMSCDIYQQHDPFFSINTFQNTSERDNFINSHVNNSSNAMFCEDDNMLEADIKW